MCLHMYRHVCVCVLAEIFHSGVMPESQWSFVSYHRLLTDLEDTVLDLMERLLYLTPLPPTGADPAAVGNVTSHSDNKITKKAEGEDRNTKEKKNSSGKVITTGRNRDDSTKTSSGKANVESLSVLLQREQQRARK